MLDFSNNYTHELLPTNEELKAKKIKILVVILIFIGLISLYKSFNIYITNKNIDKTFTAVEKIDKDDTYDFLYFDKKLNDNVRKNYKEMIDLQPEIAKSLKENKIKIFISGNSIKNSFLNISNSTNIEVSDNTVGAFIKDYKLILIKYRNPREMKTVQPIGINKENEKERLSKNTKQTTLADLYTEEQLLDFDITLNKTILYHEIGHYLDKYSHLELSFNPIFYKAYLTERNKLFASDDKYYISNISEYIAQSVSYYLMYGSVEGKNNTLKANTTETSKFIGGLINHYKDRYKNVEGGEN